MELEWQTRKHRIDQRLKAQGWKIMPWIDGSPASSLSGVAVTEFPTANGPADYALFVDGRLLGILEARKVTVNPQNILEQAKLVSQDPNDGPAEKLLERLKDPGMKSDTPTSSPKKKIQ